MYFQNNLYLPNSSLPAGPHSERHAYMSSPLLWPNTHGELLFSLSCINAQQCLVQQMQPTENKVFYKPSRAHTNDLCAASPPRPGETANLPLVFTQDVPSLATEAGLTCNRMNNSHLDRQESLSCRSIVQPFVAPDVW